MHPLVAERAKQIARAGALGQFQQQLAQVGLVNTGVDQGRMGFKARLRAAQRQRRHARIDAVVRRGNIEQHHGQRIGGRILMLHGQHRVARAAHPVRDLGQGAGQQRQQFLRMRRQALGKIDQAQPVLRLRLSQHLATQLKHDLLNRMAPVVVTGMTDGKQRHKLSCPDRRGHALRPAISFRSLPALLSTLARCGSACGQQVLPRPW